MQSTTGHPVVDDVEFGVVHDEDGAVLAVTMASSGPAVEERDAPAADEPAGPATTGRRG